MEVMTYNYKNVHACIDKVKDFNWTVKRKADHFPMWSEVEKLYNFCLEKTDCILFDPDWDEYISEYRKAVSHIKDFTMKELDKMLHNCERHLKNQIRDIYIMMEKGEVNTEF